VIDEAAESHSEAAGQFAFHAAHSAHVHAIRAVDAIQLPHHWPVQTDILTICQQMGPGLAALLLMLGIVYLLFGFNIYKALIMLNAAVLGASIGSTIGENIHAEIPMAIVGAFVAAAATWPLMKWAVAIMGGLFGALLGATLWRICALDLAFTWAGALIGLMSLGLMAFIIFRGSIMMYTSLQGAVMLICGLLGLVYKYQDLAPHITENMVLKPFLLPMAIFIPAVIGLVYQQHSFVPPIPHQTKKA
jgi:hypothetical protein